MSQPHTAPVPAAGRTQEALLGGCWLPAGDLQMAENGAFVRYIGMVQHGPHSSRGAATGTTRNVHLPRAATAACTACRGLSPGAPSHQDDEQEPLGEQPRIISHSGLLAASPAGPGNWSCHHTGREGGQGSAPTTGAGRAGCCVLPRMTPMRCRQAGSAALSPTSILAHSTWGLTRAPGSGSRRATPPSQGMAVLNTLCSAEAPGQLSNGMAASGPLPEHCLSHRTRENGSPHR